jgi:hypothetical protein
LYSALGGKHPESSNGLMVVKNVANVSRLTLVDALDYSILPDGATELQLRTQDLPAGVYMLVVEKDGARKALRILKQ